MNALDKLKVLSEDSQYDLACACGTNKLDRRKRGLDGKWLYPVSLPQGGYSILLKTLLSNSCTNDCKYCPLRVSSNVRRCMLRADEAAALFMNYLKSREVFGLFLSSGVVNTPDYTMERLNAVASILRYKYKFKGYIHLKVIPGASDAAIEESLSLANAVSLYIETPGRKHFELLGKSKDYDRDIIRPLKLLSGMTSKGGKFSRRKCTTQFIVGASDETDSEIVKYTFGIYGRLNFDRVYFSVYQPGLGEPEIPGEKRYSLSSEKYFTREHRLYQADFLIRRYGFGEKDIIFDGTGNLSLEKDPKEIWAERHPEFYPVNLNRAPQEALLRVPGIGPGTVTKILEARKLHNIRSIDELGIRGKIAEKIKAFSVLS